MVQHMHTTTTFPLLIHYIIHYSGTGDVYYSAEEYKYLALVSG